MSFTYPSLFLYFLLPSIFNKLPTCPNLLPSPGMCSFPTPDLHPFPFQLATLQGPNQMLLAKALLGLGRAESTFLFLSFSTVFQAHLSNDTYNLSCVTIMHICASTIW